MKRTTLTTEQKKEAIRRLHNLIALVCGGEYKATDEQLGVWLDQFADCVQYSDTSWIIGLILDCVDYTSGACRVNEMVGAVLPREVIERAKAAK